MLTSNAWQPKTFYILSSECNTRFELTDIKDILLAKYIRIYLYSKMCCYTLQTLQRHYAIVYANLKDNATKLQLITFYIN